MYYNSQFYTSNYYSSQYYNNSSGVVLAGRYIDRLGQLGFSGAMCDREAGYLKSLGYIGAQSDCKKQHLESLGYNGGLSDMLRQKATAESAQSVSRMMKEQGLIPV